jgi:hypothetical protein
MEAGDLLRLPGRVRAWLDRTARRLGRPPADVPLFDMGAMVPFRRADIYGDDEDDDWPA